MNISKWSSTLKILSQLHRKIETIAIPVNPLSTWENAKLYSAAVSAWYNKNSMDEMINWANEMKNTAILQFHFELNWFERGE